MNAIVTLPTAAQAYQLLALENIEQGSPVGGRLCMTNDATDSQPTFAILGGRLYGNTWVDVPWADAQQLIGHEWVRLVPGLDREREAEYGFPYAVRFALTYKGRQACDAWWAAVPQEDIDLLGFAG